MQNQYRHKKLNVIPKKNIIIIDNKWIHKEIKKTLNKILSKEIFVLQK